jgi:hypothetical protein
MPSPPADQRERHPAELSEPVQPATDKHPSPDVFGQLVGVDTGRHGRTSPHLMPLWCGRGGSSRCHPTSPSDRPTASSWPCHGVWPARLTWRVPFFLAARECLRSVSGSDFSASSDLCVPAVPCYLSPSLPLARTIARPGQTVDSLNEQESAGLFSITPEHDGQECGDRKWARRRDRGVRDDSPSTPRFLPVPPGGIEPPRAV